MITLLSFDCQRTALTDCYSTLVFDFVQVLPLKNPPRIPPAPSYAADIKSQRFEKRAEAKQILFLP